MSDFDFVARLLRDESANTLTVGKEYLVETKLAPLARKEGLASIHELVDQLRAGAPRLRQHVIEAMVNNETFFFRDVHPFQALHHQIIPELLQANPRRPLSLWSAAASTGQEPFSLALLLREYFRAAPASVLATDVSSKALERARTGRFTQLEVNRGLPAALLVKHFARQGREWQLHEEVRNLVTFRQLNLARPIRGVRQMDVILLRNVLIYLDIGTKTAILASLANILRPAGYLLLGSTETTYGLPVPFQPVQVGRSTCYRLASASSPGLTERTDQ